MNPSPAFPDTRWTQFLHRHSSDDLAARASAEHLCNAYWFPVYAAIRRSGRSTHDAEDLTQSFFLDFIASDKVVKADPSRGKFRTFLLTCLTNYLINENDRVNAQKRGAGRVVSFDGLDAEQRYMAEPRDDLSPDRIFQQEYALSVLQEGLRRLHADLPDKAALLAALRPHFAGLVPVEEALQQIADRLAMKLNTVKAWNSKLRDELTQHIREIVRDTLEFATPNGINDELSELQHLLGEATS
jgi:RNA polymerase sigma factor (sigma-70 family)